MIYIHAYLDYKYKIIENINVIAEAALYWGGIASFQPKHHRSENLSSVQPPSVCILSQGMESTISKAQVS